MELVYSDYKKKKIEIHNTPKCIVLDCLHEMYTNLNNVQLNQKQIKSVPIYNVNNISRKFQIICYIKENLT